jgi:hypothetical protein
MNKNIEVFLNEEFGYRTFKWEPQMNEDEFVSWWQNLNDSDIIKYYFNINSLPGKLTAVNAVKNGNAKVRVSGDPRNETPHYYCHFHDVDDSFIEIGESRMAYRRTSRRDWKDYWVDHQIKNKKPEEIY